MLNRKSFVIILVTAFLTILILVGWVIANLGCGEILQARTANDMAAAYYAATSGAELMYAKMRSLENQTVTWPQSVPAADSIVRTEPAGGVTIGTFSATADTVSADVFGIVSQGAVNGKSARVTVRYGFDSPFTSGYPIGSGGDMILSGARWFVLKSRVRAEGPIAAGGDVTPDATTDLVRISGDILQNQAFAPVTFWRKYDSSSGAWSDKTLYDANGDGSRITDTNGDGVVNAADCGEDPAQIDIFNADNLNNDAVINDADAFYGYYTIELNKGGYNIGPGQANFYSGDQVFDPWSVPADTPIIFVDGNTDILFNDTAWWGGSSNHTIVSTGTITIAQPSNGGDDTLALIAWGDVDTGGVRAFGGIRGNLTVYAHNDFGAYYGGKTNGTIYAEENVEVDTILPIPGLLNRDLNRNRTDWSDPANWPLGLPPNYNRISMGFTIKNEEPGGAGFVPIWQEA